jgi:hypothetical protein
MSTLTLKTPDDMRRAAVVRLHADLVEVHLALRDVLGSSAFMALCAGDISPGRHLMRIGEELSRHVTALAQDVRLITERAGEST